MGTLIDETDGIVGRHVHAPVAGRHQRIHADVIRVENNCDPSGIAGAYERVSGCEKGRSISSMPAVLTHVERLSRAA